MGSTLYDRLAEIASLEGKPKRGGISALLGLTSGRVSQIKKEGTTAKLSEESMAVLTAKGYSRDWVAFGKGAMKASTPPPDPFRGQRARAVSDLVSQLGDILLRLDPDEREIAAGHLRAVARAPEIEQRKADLIAYLTRETVARIPKASGE